MFGILDEAIARVFKATELKDKHGEVVGASMTVKGRKEIATQLQLTGKANKDNLDAAMLKESDEAFRKAKAHIAGLNGDTTLKKFSVRTLSSGIEQTTMVTQKIPRTTRLSDEKLANGLFPVELYPTMTLEEKLAKVVETRERQESQLATNALEA